MDDEHICPQNKEQQSVCKQASSAYERLCVFACLAYVLFYILLSSKSDTANKNQKKLPSLKPGSLYSNALF